MEDDIFYAIEGTMSLLMAGHWTQAVKGSFVLVPGGVEYDFENRGDTRAGVLNFSVPGEGQHVVAGVKHRFFNAEGAEVEFLTVSSPTTRGDRINAGWRRKFPALFSLALGRIESIPPFEVCCP